MRIHALCLSAITVLLFFADAQPRLRIGFVTTARGRWCRKGAAPLKVGDVLYADDDVRYCSVPVAKNDALIVYIESRKTAHVWSCDVPGTCDLPDGKLRLLAPLAPGSATPTISSPNTAGLWGHDLDSGPSQVAWTSPSDSSSDPRLTTGGGGPGVANPPQDNDEAVRLRNELLQRLKPIYTVRPIEGGLDVVLQPNADPPQNLNSLAGVIRAYPGLKVSIYSSYTNQVNHAAERVRNALTAAGVDPARVSFRYASWVGPGDRRDIHVVIYGEPIGRP